LTIVHNKFYFYL